jgi:uncharacterized protein YjbI with pentapeptide repeats
MAVAAKPGRKSKLSGAGTHLVKAIASALPGVLVSDPATLAGLASNSIASFVEAASSFGEKRDGDLSATAWDILRTAYACGLLRFMARVELERRPKGAELEELLRHLLTRAEILVEQQPQLLSLDHLLSPLKVSIFRRAAHGLPSDLRHFQPAEPPGKIRRLFEVCLFEGLRDVRSKEPKAFQLLEASLAGPLSASLERREAAARHQEYLIRLFSQQPVFGQEETGITLSELYVRQRCLWVDKQAKPSTALTPKALDAPEVEFSNRENRARARELLHVGDLHKKATEWLHGIDPFDTVRVIAGGPGSGKSTFAKALAIEVIDSDLYDVLYVPLQDIEPTGSFDTRLANLFRTRTELGFDRTESPLNWMGCRQSDGLPPAKPLLLVCDGLDEIAAPGSQEAQLVTTDFIQVLSTWLGHRNSGGLYVRAIILGRTIAAGAAFTKLAIDHPKLLRVAGLLPVSTSTEWEQAEREKLTRDTDGLAGIDQRTTYWEKWCSAVDQVNAELPQALRDGEDAKKIEELTAEPLLLYLLLWTGFIGARWKEAAENRNVVYHEIFKRIYNREWGESRRVASNRERGGHSGTHNLSLDQFFLLQEALGLASWPTGGRTATVKSFEIMVKFHLGDDQIDEIGLENAFSLRSVALQTYAKASDDDASGFEFVHKTLGEYLIANALVRVVMRAHEKVCERPSESRCRTAAEEVTRIAHAGALTIEIYRFFNDEISLRIATSKNARHLIESSLLPVLNWTVRNGLPVHQVVPQAGDLRFDALDRAERRALDVVWSFAQSVAARAYPFTTFRKSGHTKSWDAGPIKINWPSSTAFTSLFSRLSDRGHVTDTKRLTSFDFLDLSGQGVTELSYGSVYFVDSTPRIWHSISLRGAKAPAAPFYQTILREAKLTGIDLSGALLQKADLQRADLTRANLIDCELSGANLSEALLTDALLTKANLSKACLRSARLVGANLDGVRFGPRPEYAYAERIATRVAADLYRADVSRGSIKNCDFYYTNLDGVKFVGSDLSGSDLTLARFRELDLADAVMIGTRVSEESLPRLKLSAKQLNDLVVCSIAEVEARRNELKRKYAGDTPIKRSRKPRSI